MIRRPLLFVALTLALLMSRVMAQTPVEIAIVADIDPASATGIRIEGLAADSQGRLYTVDVDSRRLFRITPATGAVETLATLPQPTLGLAFDAAGNLYLAASDQILRIAADRLGAGDFDPNADVRVYASNVPGANGIAIDSAGKLYVSGGSLGIIYVVDTSGAARTFASGFVSDRTESRISTNGLAFGVDGRLYSANTGSGAIDRISINADGTTGQVERWATDPLLLGADGIAFDTNNNLLVATNERNAIVRVTADRQVVEVTSNANAGPLEFPASLAFVGTSLYATNFDIARGVNEPNDPGVGASIVRIEQPVAGLPLPVAPGAQTGQTVTPGAETPTASPTSAGSVIDQTPTPTVTPTLPLITGTNVLEPTLTPPPPFFVPTPTETTSLQFPLTPIPTLAPAPTPSSGAVRLPDTGVPSPTPIVALTAIGTVGIVMGLLIRRRRRR